MKADPKVIQVQESVQAPISDPLEPRPWLDPASTSTLLWVWDTKRTRLSKATLLRLDVVLPDGSNLLEPLNLNWHQLVLNYIYLLRDDSSLCIGTAEVHVAVAMRLLTFLKWTRLQGVYDLRRLTPELAENFSSEIALGTGHALRYTERLKKLLKEAKGDLPMVTDKFYPKRKTLDVTAICKAAFITVQGLSSDKTASQLIGRLAARHGYRPKDSQVVTKGPLPLPKPITRATHSRFIDAIRYLHKWNGQLGGNGLNFVPVPTRSDQLGSTKLRSTGHTKNLPPQEIMSLLDISLRWIYDYGPRALDLFDDVEELYNIECQRADSLDRWSSDTAASSLHAALFQFLRSEDETGIFPKGCHKRVQAATGGGYCTATNILTGKLTARSRTAVLDWIQPECAVDDVELFRLVRKVLSEDAAWSLTWPYPLTELANMIGVGPQTLKQFIETGRLKDARSLEVIESFLVSRGVVARIDATSGSQNSTYRSDRGIEVRLEEFVTQHPLNLQALDGDPWPLCWNVTSSSRGTSLSLYEALRYCIPSAAMTVIGVFQARRESELSSLATDCVSEHRGYLWLESHIAKTLRRDKKLPTVRTVEAAVALLTRWSERGRRRKGSKLLFSHWEPLGDAIVSVKPNVDLNRFARLALKTTLTSPLQIRQFRRFFAVTFMWRYRLANLPALSDFLCHSGLSMTWEYVTERVGTTVMKEAQAEFSREMLLSAALGRINLHGAFARTWSRWVEKIRAYVKSSLEFINRPDEAERLFMERIDAGMRLLRPTPGGVCAAGDRERDNKRAKCSVPDPLVPERHIKKPELARASQCAGCPFSATDDFHKDYWLESALEARSAADSSVDSIVRQRALVDAPKLERFIKIFSQSRE